MKITIENMVTGSESIKSIAVETVQDITGDEITSIIAGMLICNGWGQKTIAECFEDYAYEHLPQIEKEEEEPEDAEYTACDKCMGKGVVLVTMYGDGDPSVEDCPKCGGSGSVKKAETEEPESLVITIDKGTVI